MERIKTRTSIKGRISMSMYILQHDHNIFHRLLMTHILRTYEKSPVSRYLYEKVFTEEEKEYYAPIIRILDLNIETFRFRLLWWIFLRTKRKFFYTCLISWMYNNANGQKDSRDFFIVQNISILTKLRLTVAWLSRMHMVKYNFLARVFRECVTDREFTEIRLLNNYFLKNHDKFRTFHD